MRRLVALGFSLLIGVAYVSACTSFDAAGTDVGDGGAAFEAGDSAVCMPPACGGAGGRCGTVNACGLAFSCGDCAPPFACVGGTCTCMGTKAACQDQNATCGDLDDGCGQPTNCGSCEAGTSCNAADGGLRCASGQCVPEAVAKTCTGKCKGVTNNCGKVVSCTCPSDQLCIGGGKTSSCACPARTTVLNQYYDGRHACYTQTAACPGTNQGTIAKLYGGVSDGLELLYRCRNTISASESAFFLTPHTDCEGLGAVGYVLETAVGACAPGPVCGAIPLYRYFRAGGNGDFLHSLSPTSPLADYTAFGTACYVWTP